MNIRSYLSLSILSLSLAFAAGCAVDPGDEENPDDTSMTEQDLTSNEKAAFDFFVARGLTKRQSAGIVGNLIQESGVNPRAIQFGGGPGRGIAQWSVGGRWDTTRNDNVVGYATKHSESRWALHTQLGFTWYELTTFPGYGLAALRKTTTIAGATVTFERDFEKCGACDEAKRIAFAKQVFNAFANKANVAALDDAASAMVDPAPVATDTADVE